MWNRARDQSQYSNASIELGRLWWKDVYYLRVRKAKSIYLNSHILILMESGMPEIWDMFDIFSSQVIFNSHEEPEGSEHRHETQLGIDPTISKGHTPVICPCGASHISLSCSRPAHGWTRPLPLLMIPWRLGAALTPPGTVCMPVCNPSTFAHLEQVKRHSSGTRIDRFHRSGRP